MAEIAKATDWQNQSIRGFFRGTLGNSGTCPSIAPELSK